MTSSQSEQPAVKRLPYEKPALRSISLVADQVLGVGCKTTGFVTQSTGYSWPCVGQLCRAVSGS
jgi:hypothetical protein